MRQITANLERLKLPTKASGATSVPGRSGTDDTARRPPSVKAALSVSFGQRAPHRASTRDSSPVRRSFPSSNGTDERSGDRAKDRERDRSRDRDHERERPRSRDSSHDYRDRARDRDRTDRRDRDRDRERDRRDRDHERDRDRHSSRDRDRDRDRRRDRRDRSPERDRHRHRSKSRSRSRSPPGRSRSPRKSGSPSKEKAAMAANLLKLRDLYGDASGKKAEDNQRLVKDSNSEEVIRLGGSTWR